MMDMRDNVEVGKTYTVSFDDCCVAGSFTATLELWEHDDEFIYKTWWDNGVTLTELGGVVCTEVAR